MKQDQRFRNGVEIKDMIVYTAVSLGANFCGFLAYAVIALSLRGKVAATYFQLLVIMLISMLTAAALTFFYFRRVIPMQYEDNERRRSWLNNALWAILPGELLRCLFTLIDLGNGNGTGKFALVPSMLFEQTYMKWAGIWNRSNLTNTPTDIAAYLLCYLIYLAVNLALLLVLYRILWKKCDAEAARHAAHLREDASHDPEKLSH